LLRVIFIALFNVILFASTPKSVIVEVDKNYAQIEPTDAKIGSSGIVVHNFDKTHSSIVARAILTKKDQIKLEVFDALSQPNLPRPNIKPAKGDKVILEYLYDRGLIIAPNLKTYQYIEQRLTDTRWLHPDLFAVELSKIHHKAPTKEDFKNFCNKYSIAKIVIALKDKGVVADCYSFKPISTFEITKGDKSMFPFYMRLKEIRGGIFSFFNKEKYDYYIYYKKLLESK
jgi:hypothetical protein